MDIPGSCDVAVIGGGPAGSLAAAYLARSGYDIVLFEKQKHPRPTVGESLIPDFWKYCDEVGVSETLQAEGFISKAGGTVDWNGTRRRVAFKDYGYTRPALHVERDRFDDILLRHAAKSGVRVLEEVAVHGVQLNGHAVRLSYRPPDGQSAEIHCRFVIDASGQASLIGRQLGLRVLDEDFRFMSVWGYFKGARYYAADGETYAAVSCRDVPPTTYVCSVPGTGDWGWCWHILLRDCTSLGFVLPREVIKDVKDSGLTWEQFLLKQCEKMPTVRELLEPAELIKDSVRVVRDYSYRCNRVSGPGFFLVGDAAGFIDPIFSIGVVLGMYSARAAAWSIDHCFRSPARTARYQAIYTNQLQARMELARTLALPQYELAGPASAQAKNAAQFMDSQAHALMLAASSLTARSQHFLALFDEPAAAESPS